jgi:hypothetical protein
MKLTQIYEGWKNHLLPEKKLKKLIDKVSVSRIEVCNNCEFHSKNHNTVRVDAHCTNCGCTLSAKTKCLSCKCPIEKWDAVMTKEQEEEIDNG